MSYITNVDIEERLGTALYTQLTDDTGTGSADTDVVDSSRDEAEGEAKGDAKGETKGDAKGETKGDAKGEAKGETKGDAKGEAKKGDAKAGTRRRSIRAL